MGDALARLREMALAIRCRSDAAFVSPVHLFIGPVYSLRSLSERLLSGRIPPAEFAGILRDASRNGLGIKGAASPVELVGRNRADLNSYFAQYRKPILAKAPRKADLDKQHAAALREADARGSLLPSIEKHLDALSETTLAMQAMAADAWLSRYSRTKVRYAKTLLRWQRAYDALARFIEEPPTESAATKKKTSGDRRKKNRKRAGGRPAKWSTKQKKQMLDDHARYLKTTKKPLKETAWVTVWATEDGREMTRKDALCLWQAAKRGKYPRQT
jgi:hypothetical protein